MACTMFGAIDVGSYEVNLKIYELSARKGIREVNHVRHRMELGKDTFATGKIGVEMVDEAIRSIPDFPERLANELKHCIIAHHGELEYGSPKKPALAEALALNLADNADAKMQTLTEIFKGKTGTEWLGYNRLFESNLRRTSERNAEK